MVETRKPTGLKNGGQGLPGILGFSGRVFSSPSGHPVQPFFSTGETVRSFEAFQTWKSLIFGRTMCHLMVNWWFRPLRNNPYGHFGIYIRFLGCIPPGKDRWRSPLPLVLGNPCARKQARASELGSGERRSPSTFTFCVFKFTWQTMPCGLSKWPLLQIPLNESFGGIEPPMESGSRVPWICCFFDQGWK